MKFWNHFIQIEIDEKKAKDTGMAIAAVLILIEFFNHTRLLINIAFVVLVLDLIFPRFFTILAYVWFGTALLIGKFTSGILLFLIYILFVLPAGTIRQIFGKDELQLKKWKLTKESVFKTRNHLYNSQDLQKPY